MNSEIKEMAPLISIIIPTFNSAATLRKTLESIAAQSFRNFEVIIADGGSKDETLNITGEFLQVSVPGFTFSGPDKGIYDAMNKGIAESRGEWLYFLGSDDALYDDKVLEDVAHHMKQTNDVVYGDVFNHFLGRRYDGEFDFKKISEDGICHQSIFYRRNLFETFGLYDIDMKVYAHIYLDKILFANPDVRWQYIDRVIADYDGSGMSRYSFDTKYWKHAESLLNQHFSGKVSKKEIYHALLPYTRWHFSADTLKVGAKIFVHTGSAEGLKNWFNHPYQFARLAFKKIIGKK